MKGLSSRIAIRRLPTKVAPLPTLRFSVVPRSQTRFARRQGLPLCRNSTKAGEGGETSLKDFASILDSSLASAEWAEEIRLRGMQVVHFAEELREEISVKSRELTDVEDSLSRVAAEMEEVKKIQVATEKDLQSKINECESMKKELAELHEGTAPLQSYRELEYALAAVESELEQQSEALQARESVDVSKMNEIVQEQQCVFEALKAALKVAEKEKARAEEAAEAARLKSEEMVMAQSRLKQDQELLSKELSQLQILYAEKEMQWANDLTALQENCSKLKEEAVGMEMTIVTKERKIEKMDGVFKNLKSEFEENSSRLTELRREVAELRGMNSDLEARLMEKLVSPDQQQFTRLRSQLSRLEVRATALEEEIEAAAEREKGEAERYEALERDYRVSQRKCAQLEQRVTILQMTMEDKSTRLVAAQKEKRGLKAEADRLQREATSLRQQLLSAEKHFEKLTAEIKRGAQERRDLQQRYHEEIVAVAERQQEAQRVILYHQEHKNENRDLRNAIADLQNQLEKNREEMVEVAKSNEARVLKLSEELKAAQESIKERDIQLEAAREDEDRFKSKIDDLKKSMDDSQASHSTQMTELQKNLLAAQNTIRSCEEEIERSAKEMTKLQNELSQRQRIIQARDNEIKMLKDDSRLANERVEALRGQITSMQTISREMESEMVETDNVVTELNAKLREIQLEADEKQRRIEELSLKVGELEAKGKQSMSQFSSQIESLEEYSKQQEALVESFFEEKQSLESKVAELEADLKGKAVSESELQSLYNSAKRERDEFKTKLEARQSDLEMAKEAASNELAEASAILDKAERMVAGVENSLDEQMELNGADRRVEEKIRSLEADLERERKSVEESREESDALEAEIRSLKARLVDLESVKTAKQSESQESIEMKERLSKSLAAEEAALGEIHRLREQLKAVQADVPINHTSADERFNDLRRHAKTLEEENERLKKAATKRNQILAQSRHFIEQYLDRSINNSSLSDLQP